jgi:hypothetical protein
MSELEQGFDETVLPRSEVAQGAVLAKRAVIYLRVSTAEQAHGDGASEGYSIPAQRDACTRKAHDLGAQVVAEFVDRGESARSAARPGLQLMLGRLAEHKDVEYVIVHKVDRLARNRADDVQIQLGIEREGSRRLTRPQGNRADTIQTLRHSTAHPGLISGVRGSTMNSLVELRGFGKTPDPLPAEGRCPGPRRS